MTISSIRSDLTSQVATVLGAGWSELNYIRDLERNKFRDNDQRYGVLTGSASSVTGTVKSLTLDFNMSVVLTKSFVNRSDDSKEREIEDDIYDEFDTLNINIFQKKLNNSTVLLVSELSYDAPVVIDKGTTSITVNFIVKYRNATT